MSRSDYKNLYEGYIDNTTTPLPPGIKIDSKTISIPKRNITGDIIDKFLKLVYTFNDRIWTDCGPSVQIAKLQTNEFYPAMDIIKKLEIDNIIIKETDKSLTILKLCSTNTILNNRTDISNGDDVISEGDNGPILPFKRSTFNIDDKKRNNICDKLLKYINAQKWSSCNSIDMFQQFTSTCEIDLNTDFTRIVEYKFDNKNKNPHIIQLIDMCRPKLKLKFEISYNSTTKKIIFYKLCKENIQKKVIPYL